MVEAFYDQGKPNKGQTKLTKLSAPTTDSATWCFTPAAASAARMLRVDFSKNSRTALSSNEGEFVTSTTTSAPASAPFAGGFLPPPHRSGRPRSKSHRTAIRAGQDFAGCRG